VSRLKGIVFILVLLLAAAMAPHAAGSTKAPFELIRELRNLQDALAQGDLIDHKAQQELMAKLRAQLAAVDPEVWREPRNLRAVALYGFSGGDPSILRRISSLNGLPKPEAELARAALAYSEGRNEEAREILLGMDARKSDPITAGTLALVQAALIDKSAPDKALVYLDQARLLSPGTLIEESALRRQVLLLISVGRLDEIDRLLRRYVRQFGKSYYAGAFWRQLSAEIASGEYWDDPGRMATLEVLLATFDRNDRRHVCELLAQEGIARGNIELVRFAASLLLQMAKPGDAAAPRAQLYEAAVLIVTDEYERGYAALTQLGREALDREDAELLDAAISLARDIRREPAVAPNPRNLEQSAADDDRLRALSSIGADTMERARTLAASVDALVSGGKR
jgi:chemotaxis protein MotC